MPVSVEMWLALGANLTSLVVAAGGWLFAWKLQKEKRRQDRRDKLLDRALREVHARIVLEEKSVDYFVDEQPLGRQALKVELRDLVEQEIGYRPAMSRSEIKRLIEQNAR
ncbi:hypothetical protein [Porphyrobacter sp. ULC335]|uniref:hypothetical protein n=1 Tax=Porphyrobacter sp. ULC335 TaxID=2854260 RepID=UPI00221FD283|nr:hypothetical protein [Porphyrobacter sp. ULC335]UYV16346.1 hypothetical protein KVF90_03150 [Porphyrobacter sp. ULC335]